MEANIIRLGGLYDGEERNRQRGAVFSVNGCSPTLDTNGGGNAMPLIVEREESNGTRYWNNPI